MIFDALRPDILGGVTDSVALRFAAGISEDFTLLSTLGCYISEEDLYGLTVMYMMSK